MLVIFLGRKVRRRVVEMEKSSSCFQLWMILGSAFDNMPQGYATEEVFVEASLS
jgi:hypothetical protein